MPKHNQKGPVVVDGLQKLTLADIVEVAHNDRDVILKIDLSVKERSKKVLESLHTQIENGVQIYGATSSYGGQSSRLITDNGENHYIEKAKQISRSIVHVDVSTGPEVNREITRAAMLLRVNMLAPGYSGIREETLQLLTDVLNSEYSPIVGQYGSLGASGDLAQNGRILSTLLQLDSAKVRDADGKIHSSGILQDALNINPLVLDPKEGLGLVNGDNFSTAAAALIWWELNHLMYINLATSALVIQALKGNIRHFHPVVSAVRPHRGQGEVARVLRELLIDSKLAAQDLKAHVVKPKGQEIQDPYSIRCLPQFYGPDMETMEGIRATIETNANSVSDNPIWTTPELVTDGEEPYQWVSSGNFLAMYMSEAMDKMRKIAVHMVKQNDRHLSRLVHPYLNRGLPANLSDEGAISQCTFKGLQTQMGMYETYAGLLAAPVSTAFGVHEELNQDITSHGMTSAHQTLEALQLTKYAIATNLIAVAQAVDLRGGVELLSPATQHFYNWIRERIPYIKEEQPLGHYVESLSSELQVFPFKN